MGGAQRYPSPSAPALMGIARSTHPTTLNMTSRSRGPMSPSFASMQSPKRGSRECRVLAAPAVSCAIVRKEHAHEHTGAAGTLRHSLRKEVNGAEKSRYINVVRLMCSHLCRDSCSPLNGGNGGTY